MAQFKFSLASVLRHRKHLEEEKQRDLALLESEMRQYQLQLDQINQSVRSSQDDLRQNRLVGTLDLSFLAGHRRHMLAVQRQVVELAQKMSQLQRQIDEARRLLAEAAKQRKIIEKLRERQQQRWQSEQTQKELAELDDATMRAAAWSAMGLSE